MFLAFCQHFDLDPTKVQKPFSDNIPLRASEVENEGVPVIEVGDVELRYPDEDSESDSEESTEDDNSGLEPEIESEEPMEDENSEDDEDVASSDVAEETLEENSGEAAEGDGETEDQEAYNGEE